MHFWDDISLYTLTHPDETSYEISYERDGETYTAQLELRKLENDASPMLGVVGGEMVYPGILGSLEYGFYKLQYWMTYTVDSLRMLVTGQVGLQDMSGPVGMAAVVDEVYEAAAPAGLLAVVLSLMNFSTLVSANLGVMNLLPIPALDGGRLIFLLVEAVRRKRVPPEKEGMVHFVGFAFLMIFMVVVLFNDIIKLF